MKFVPASGAASRMFKDLYAFIDGKKSKPDSDFMRTFFGRIYDFPFFRRLNLLSTRYYQQSVPNMIKDGKYKEIISLMMDKDGLGYSKIPKALVHFHIVPGTARTAIEEHFSEGVRYAAGKDRTVKLHFTVSQEHIPMVTMKIEEIQAFFERMYGVNYDVTLSIQKPSTDTVAATPEGNLFRDKDGKPLLRPAGHGALIENLNDLDADVVFIKNIDNVSCESKQDISILHKKITGGILIGTRQKIFGFLEELDKCLPSDERLDEMISFMHKVLNITHDNTETMSSIEKADYIFSKLNRPIRVCGMVTNEGVPGGGPFLVYSPDGTVAPQILESSQLNPDDKKSTDMLRSSTHFNPVDLVCSLHDWKGRKFHLPDFVDDNTGFVSIKSYNGKELKALELPGLWNGAMSDWNTIFVEVPVETFNPVKTVNDLLRPMHQNI